MKVAGKSVYWEVIKTEKFELLHDHGVKEVKLLKIQFMQTNFSFLIKINEREDGCLWLGPGLFIEPNLEIGISKDEVHKPFYIRPKLTWTNRKEIEEVDVERIVQWLYSKKFKFIESRYYNYPKGD